MRLSALYAAICLALMPALPAAADMAPLVPPQLDRLQRVDGAHVVPDRFLRRWDPVTILFDEPTGPEAGGPEDAPDRLVTLSPAKPGSWTWLSAKTLQFRPTEPWEPLRRETVTVAGSTTRLVPLLPVPSATGPADPANGTAGLDTVALTFDQPVDLAALARLLTIDIIPQAGVAETGAQTLTAQDFDLRQVERAARSDKQTVIVVLRRPVPDGRVATLHLRLSDEPGLDDPNFTLALRSATPFKLTDTTCGDSFNRADLDGVTRLRPIPGLPPVRAGWRCSSPIVPRTSTSSARATFCGSRHPWTTSRSPPPAATGFASQASSWRIRCIGLRSPPAPCMTSGAEHYPPRSVPA